MKDLVIISLSGRGFRYVRELTDVEYIRVRISPRSYREGEKCGFMIGCTVGGVFGLLAGIALIVGQLP